MRRLITLYALLLTPYPLPLTPYPLPFTPYPLPLTPYPLPLFLSAFSIQRRSGLSARCRRM